MNVQTHNTPRPPVVTVMGHIDHGKSTLLDYIRKTRVTETEAGGITQHISAYEVVHTTPSGEERKITFLDTPGHEAFQHLRSRGSSAADLAILVVAADDGVKPQTLEALKAIDEARIPYLVTISKIDKANADIERTKSSLLEHGIYLENLGGSVPYVPISSKTGEGVSSLLDLLLLAADLEELTGDPNAPGTGLVIESHCDPKRGISAVLVLKDGTVRAGEYVVAGCAYAPLRIMEDFRGAKITLASFSSPIAVVGFSAAPPVGATFHTVATKKEAQAIASANEVEAKSRCIAEGDTSSDTCFSVPIVIKSDVTGSIDAIKHELRKLESGAVQLRVIHEGIGTITESDVKLAAASKDTIIIGFNVGVDAAALDVAQRVGVEIARFAIIYELTDWLPSAIAVRKPKVRGRQTLGTAKILKCFSHAHKLTTVGCRIESGEFKERDRVILMRRDEELAEGRIESMKSGKADTSRLGAGNDCGVQLAIELTDAPVYGDTLIAFTMSES